VPKKNFGLPLAIALINALKDQLPGYLVPKFVEEVSGKRSKQTIV